MSTEPKNLHVSEALLTKLDSMAQKHSVTVDELVQNILTAAVEERKTETLFSKMQAHARAKGLTPDDVVPAIAEYRRIHKTRSR